MTDRNIARAFFVALLLAVTLAFFGLICGFMQPIFWAIALGIVVYPLHARLARRLENRESLAASISVIVVIIVVILPLIGLGAAVAREGAALYERLDNGDVGVATIYSRVQQSMPQHHRTHRTRRHRSREALQEQAQSAAVTASQYIAQRALSIGQGTLRGTVFFFLMLYLLFFFLRDGPRMLEALVRALPLGDQRERHLLGRFAEVSRATIKGTLVVGIVQGAIGGIAFAVLGIGAPVLWGDDDGIAQHSAGGRHGARVVAGGDLPHRQRPDLRWRGLDLGRRVRYRARRQPAPARYSSAATRVCPIT